MKKELIEFCRDLVKTPSLSGQEGEIARLIESKMKELGYDSVVIDRYGSVIGRIDGKRPGKTVLMDGHIDTVDISDSALWSMDPYGAIEKDGKIYGRGTSDMKGGVATMIFAAAGFADSCNRDFAGSLVVSCTVHEECFEGVSSREITKNYKPDFVIILEATNMTLKRGQRGRAEIIVETIGKTCHSSNPEKGINAVMHMMEVIKEITEIKASEHPLLGKGILELTDIISNPYPGASVVPGFCRVTYDRRTLTGETKESILAQVNEAIERAKAKVPNLNARAYLAEGQEKCWTGEMINAKRFFPAWEVPEEGELVQKALAGLKDAGIETQISHFAFCTNGSHYCGEAGVPTIGFGPSYENLAHIIDEYIEIEHLEKAYAGLCGILKRLTD